MSGPEFIVKTVCDSPGEVTILALGPLTNLAKALMIDPDLGSKWVGGP
jgi:inosine-uridine nucleoside N-ribohydrolase